MDNLTITARSKVMATIRSKGTRPELIVENLLRSLGYQFETQADLPGRPDFVLSDRRIVILTHGCFFHRHQGCKECRTPKTNVDYWQKKFEKRLEQDRLVRQQLRQLGYRVKVIWECEVDDPDLSRKLFHFCG